MIVLWWRPLIPLQAAWQEAGHRMSPRSLAAYAHDATVVRIFPDPLNTKIVGRDEPSHASAGLASDRIVALFGFLSIEEIWPWNQAS